MKKRISGFAFHCHHDELFEWVYDYDERVEFIKGNKPEKERELRLRLFQMIPSDRIPPKLLKARKAYVKAGEACVKAWEAYGKAWKACVKAGEAYGKAWEAYYPEMEKLHKELCPDCPWNGKTIFSGRRK